MKQFDIIKKIHDLLVMLGFEYEVRDGDTVYKKNIFSEIVFSRVVFNENQDGLCDDNWEKYALSRDGYDFKCLYLFNPRNGDSATILTIDKEGKVDGGYWD